MIPKKSIKMMKVSQMAHLTVLPARKLKYWRGINKLITCLASRKATNKLSDSNSTQSKLIASSSVSCSLLFFLGGMGEKKYQAIQQKITERERVYWIILWENDLLYTKVSLNQERESVYWIILWENDLLYIIVSLN